MYVAPHLCLISIAIQNVLKYTIHKTNTVGQDIRIAENMELVLEGYNRGEGRRDFCRMEERGG